MSLSRQVIKSGFWLQISRIIQLGSNFIVSVILARLLLPADFGLAGLVTLYGAFVAQFTMLGLTLGIIQKKDINQRQLSTLYWINLGFNLFTALIVAGIAPLAAKYYKQPQMIPLILLYCVSFLISPFFQVHRRLLEKKIYFEKIAKIEVAASIGSGIVGIGMAFAGFGVYSIVWQSIALNLIYMISTMLNIKWKPDFIFSFQEVKELIFFSVKMKGARMVNFLERNIDFIILSKMFNASLFGFYSLAYRIMYFPVRRISYVFGEILFPAFSNIQDNIEKIREGYLRSIQMVAMAAMPLSVVLAIYTRPLIVLILGEKWLPISSLLFILSLAGLLQSIETVGDSIYPALNFPQTLFWIEIVRTVVTGIAVYIGGTMGLFEVAVAIFIARILLFSVTLFILNKLIHVKFREFAKLIYGPLISCLVMFAVLYFIKDLAAKTAINLVFALVAGCAAYMLFSLVMNFKDISYVYQKIMKK
jgi:PST family polysaccharide transporter